MVCELVHESAGPRIVDVELALPRDNDASPCAATIRAARGNHGLSLNADARSLVAEFEIVVGRSFRNANQYITLSGTPINLR